MVSIHSTAARVVSLIQAAMSPQPRIAESLHNMDAQQQRDHTNMDDAVSLSAAVNEPSVAHVSSEMNMVEVIRGITNQTSLTRRNAVSLQGTVPNHARRIPNANTNTPSIHPQFRSKPVCKLFCSHCKELLCCRGMKAILLGNTKVELYSTDSPPSGVQLVFEDYATPNCLCRIRDAACLGCGNVVGYHVTQPCNRCLDSCNNGHFWMFQSTEIYPIERSDGSDASKPLRWANVLCPSEDKEEVTVRLSMETGCR